MAYIRHNNEYKFLCEYRAGDKDRARYRNKDIKSGDKEKDKVKDEDKDSNAEAGMTIQEMRERKIELGYTNEKLAEMTKIPYSTIQKIFAGKTTAPRRSTILALEKILLQEEPGRLAHREPVSPAAIVPSGVSGVSGESGESVESGASRVSGTAESAKPGTVYTACTGLPDGMVMESAPTYGTAKGAHKYTIYDYFSFPDERQRCEVIDGVIYDMTSPTLHHQWVLTQLGHEFSNFIDEHNGDCRAFVAPLDVTPDPADIYTIVQPDVMIICDRSLLEGKYCEGAPDLVVEILSPSTRRKDLTIKTAKYAAAGVREYWIVDIDAERVLVYDFEHGDRIGIYGFDTDVPVGIWDGKCKVNFRRIMDRL